MVETSCRAARLIEEIRCGGGGGDSGGGVGVGVGG